MGGLILSAVGVMLAPYSLNWIHVPSDIYPYALSYASIYLSGLALSMTYNIGAGILRAVGDSKTPFYILFVSNASNVMLDLLFVGVFKWHVAGSALGTVLSQMLSAALVLRALNRTNHACRVDFKAVRLHKAVLKAILLLGVPVAVQSVLFPFANMMMQANINALGTDSVTAWALCGKMDFMVWLTIDSLAAAISTFAAQNYGAGQHERIRQGVRIGMGITLLLTLLMSAALYQWCEPFGMLFLAKADSSILAISTPVMRLLSPLYLFYVFGAVLSGAIRGMGDTVRPMLVTMLSTCGVRIVWTLFVVPTTPTLMVILWGYPVSWLITAASFAVFYLVFVKRSRLSNRVREM